jgi:hypothetical protein
VDWANAAPDTSSDAATIEAVKRLVIMSSMKLVMRFQQPERRDVPTFPRFR